MSMIEIKGVSKSYGAQAAVIDLSVSVPEGEMLIIVGPSGCGKSTLLKCINRMVEIDRGSIRVAGRDIGDYVPEKLRRGIGYCIQEVGLFPHMSVYSNIATVPRLLGWDERRISERVESLINISGLSMGHLKKYPSQLSGGEAQRVGVLRALAADPPILLMDEPFGAVDPLTRGNLQRQFLDIQRKLRKTVLFVTHDVEEAVMLADRIAVMRSGRFEAIGSPLELEMCCEGGFVGDFLGPEYGLKLLGRYRLSALRMDDLERKDPEDGRLPFRVGGESTLKDIVSEILKSERDYALIQLADGSTASISLADVKRLMQGAIL